MRPFSEALTDRLKELEFDQLTPVQKTVIPKIQNNEHVIIQTGYGQGKTASFVLPLIDALLDADSPKALIVLPTRSLAFKVKRTIDMYQEKLAIHYSLFFHADDLVDPGSQIIITTPDMIEYLQDWLPQMEYIVIDELNLMDYFGLMDDVTQIFEANDNAQKTVFFQEADDIVTDFLEAYMGGTDPITIDVDDIPIAEIAQQKSLHENLDDKINQLMHTLKQNRSRRILVVVNDDWKMKKIAMMIKRQLNLPNRYLFTESDKPASQDIRKFLEGIYHVLIVDGINDDVRRIKDANQIIHFDIPEDAGVYREHLDMLSEKSKRHNPKAVINIGLFSEHERIRELESELGVEMSEASMPQPQDDVEYGRVRKERQRRIRI